MNNTYQKMIIFSDSHQLYDVSEIITWEQSLDFFPTISIHAGDSQLEYTSKIIKQIDYKVQGNCDFDELFPEVILTEIEEIGNLLITHGHLNAVKVSTTKLEELAENSAANLVVYGHTHILDIRYLNTQDLLIINPGSVALPKGGNPPTYIVVLYTSSNYQIIVKNAQTFATIQMLEFSRHH